MRTLLSLTIVAAISLGAAPVQRDSAAPVRRDLLGKQFDARVTRVADGDTLEATLTGESRPVRIRLQGVDAPELGEVFSREAHGFLRVLVFAQSVRVSVRDIDRYGRLVARVTAAGTDASVALVRAGLACHAYAADAALAREESQARSAGAGFWAATAKKPACVSQTSFSGKRPTAGSRVAAPPAPTMPASPSSRRAGASAPPAATATMLQYRGNVSSRVYHTSACRNFTCKNCTRVFASEAEAKAAGFRPASDCPTR